MKKNLLVTLADENYVEQAKQLFSSVYWNAGWKGDYMLLAHEIPEKKLKWFRKKGILIKKCKPFYKGKIEGWPITILSKFYLFTPEFKKYKNLVYLDVDIIVKASLDTLTDIKGFAACGRISRTFISPPLTKIKEVDKTLKRLKENYNLKEPGFNSGVMAFDTDIIKENTFSKLKDLFKLYRKINISNDQSILNLFFYKNFILLPYVYNRRPDYMIHSCNIKPKKIRGIVLHFTGKNKPWLTKNSYYKEWKNNLEKAELINLKKPQLVPLKKWTRQEILKYNLYLKARAKIIFIKARIIFVYLVIDKYLGKIGIFLKKHSPELYSRLKNLKINLSKKY